MKKRYLEFPYEKEHISHIADKFMEDDITYVAPDEDIIFHGTDLVEGDDFTINAEPANFKFKDGKYYYETSEDNLKTVINYKKRLDIMQQNTANALVRLCAKRSSNLIATSYKVDKNTNAIYFNITDIAFSTIEKLEELANYLTLSNPVTNYDQEKSELVIKGFGNIPYEGPSVKRLGECGIIKITSIEKENSTIKINISAAQRSLSDYNKKSKIIENLQKILFVNSDEDILSEVKNLKAKKEDLKAENKKMVEELGLEQVMEYKKLATNVDGINYIYKVLRNVNFKDLKFISNTIMKELNYVQIYGIPNGTMAQIIVSRSANLNVNLKEIFDKIAPQFGLIGSGNMYSVQGNVSFDNLASVMESFLIAIKNSNTKIISRQ